MKETKSKQDKQYECKVKNSGPTPLQLLRETSNASSVSCTSNYSSIDGFTEALMQGGGCSVGASTLASDEFTHDFSAIDDSLRNNGKESHSTGDLSESTEMKLLDFSARPSLIGEKAKTIGSCSNDSTTRISKMPPPFSPIKMKQKEFCLDKYIENTQRREEYSLKVVNALLSVYGNGVKKDSRGGRFPLHTALAGRASYQVIETLVSAYPKATRRRTEDKYLALHVAAYYGISDARIAPLLIRPYPDACLGKNKWGRNPLEEALLSAGEIGRKHQAKLVEALRRPINSWNSEFNGRTIDSIER